MSDQYQPEMVQVTLKFDIPLEEMKRHLGIDFNSETGKGITVEACAAALILNHRAQFGYIHWQTEPFRKDGTMLLTNEALVKRLGYEAATKAAEAASFLYVDYEYGEAVARADDWECIAKEAVDAYLAIVNSR